MAQPGGIAPAGAAYSRDAGADFRHATPNYHRPAGITVACLPRRRFHMNKLFALILVVISLCGFAAPALAAKAEVVDQASFFSPDAVARANQKLADVSQKAGREMRVETYAEIPAEKRSGYSEENKRQFFQDWTRRRAQELGVRGVMVLICRDPSTLQVEVGDETERSGAFTQADRTQ